MSAFFAWAQFIAGLILFPSHRRNLRKALNEWYHASEPRLPAPKLTNCPQPCVHLSQEDAREGKACPEHPCTCEPTDPTNGAAS